MHYYCTPAHAHTPHTTCNTTNRKPLTCHSAPPTPELAASAKSPAPPLAQSQSLRKEAPADASLSASPRPLSASLKSEQVAAAAPALTQSSSAVPAALTTSASSLPAAPTGPANPLQHLTKEQLRQVVVHFNNKPEAAVAAVAAAGHWRGEPDELAAFLWTGTGLAPAKVGEYLSEPKPASAAALRAYCTLFQFAGKSFADALREFLSRFRLPGEAQKIDRIMEAFAARFHACNPQAFPSADTAYVLAFSTIMCASLT